MVKLPVTRILPPVLPSVTSAFQKPSLSASTVHNLTISAFDSTANWLPNATGMVTFDIHNAVLWKQPIYSISDSGHQVHGCLKLMKSPQFSRYESVMVGVQTMYASEGDSCQLLMAWDEISETSYHFTHEIVVGARTGLNSSTVSAILTLGLLPGYCNHSKCRY